MEQDKAKAKATPSLPKFSDTSEFYFRIAFIVIVLLEVGLDNGFNCDIG